VLLTCVTFGIYGFWLGIKMRKWLAQNTVFEDGIQEGDSSPRPE